MKASSGSGLCPTRIWICVRNVVDSPIGIQNPGEPPPAEADPPIPQGRIREYRSVVTEVKSIDNQRMGAGVPKN